MNIFNYISDILTNKKGDLLDNIDSESTYNQYMINRWLSMYSPSVAVIVNETVNKHYSIFDTKKDGYRFLVNVVPQQKPYRINYIKKVKHSNTDEGDAIKILATNLELSEKEIRYYVDTHNIDLDEVKQICQQTNK